MADIRVSWKLCPFFALSAVGNRRADTLADDDLLINVGISERSFRQTRGETKILEFGVADLCLHFENVFRPMQQLEIFE